MTADGRSGEVGAIVLNRGKASPTGFCRFRDQETDKVTGVIAPSGPVVLHCEYEDYVLAGNRAVVETGWDCYLTFDGARYETTRSRFVGSPSGRANMTCHFGGKG